MELNVDIVIMTAKTAEATRCHVLPFCIAFSFQNIAKLYFYAILFTYLHIHLQNRIISTLGGIYIMPHLGAIVNQNCKKIKEKVRLKKTDLKTEVSVIVYFNLTQPMRVATQ